MPPCIWPSTRVGLIARPTSCAAWICSTLHRAELEVDLDLRHLRGKAVGRVGHALAVGVERHGRRVEVTARRARRSPAASAGQSRRSSDVVPPSLPTSAKPSSSRRTSASSAAGRSSRSSSCCRSAVRRAAARCPKRRSGARPTSCRRRRSGRCRPSPDAAAPAAGRAASANICGMIVCEPWPMSTRAVVERDERRARRRSAAPTAHRRRVGDHRVADAVPHAGDAGAAARTPCRRRLGVERAAAAARAAAHAGRSASRHCAQADARVEHAGRWRAVARRAARCDGGTRARSTPHCAASSSISSSPSSRRLRHAEAAERRRRRCCW